MYYYKLSNYMFYIMIPIVTTFNPVDLCLDLYFSISGGVCLEQILYLSTR